MIFTALSLHILTTLLPLAVSGRDPLYSAVHDEEDPHSATLWLVSGWEVMNEKQDKMAPLDNMAPTYGNVVPTDDVHNKAPPSA